MDDEQLARMIANRVKYYRDMRYCTQADLGKSLGVTSATISDIECGKVGLSAVRLYRISVVLDVPFKAFFQK